MSADPSRHRLRDTLGIAAVVSLPLCCAGPALLAAGALGALGTWLLDPVLIGAAVLLAVAGLAWRLRHHTTRTGPPVDGAATVHPCWPPPPTSPPAAGDVRVQAGRKR